MANIRVWLEEAEDRFGEPITAIVIGEYSPSYSREHHHKEGQVLTREEGLQILDEEFDDGYGGAYCYPIIAWSRKRVFFIQEYDGATKLSWVPRNPKKCEPFFNRVWE